MVEIEELDELELEDNPGEEEPLSLEVNPGEDDDEDDMLELEANPGEQQSTWTGDGVLFEANVAANGDAEDSDYEEEEWEIPFALEGPAAPNTETVIDVRLSRKGDERLGLVLDAANVIVALREGTPAAASGELFVGDTVLAVQGVACTAEKRVALLLRELPDAATYVFTVRRALDLTASDLGGMAGFVSEPVAEHGPLLTPEEAAEQAQRELEMRQKMREEVDKLPEGDELKEQLSKELAPRNLTESKYMSSKTELEPGAKRTMQGMWYRQARQELDRRLSAAEMLKDEGNDKFSEGEYKEALEEYEYALQLFAYEMANLCRDQQAAELGDHKKGLSSDDLPKMQKIRVPCLLNMAACHIKLGSRPDLTKALECCAEVLQATPPAAQRAKAYFRMGQAHFALENFRESWTALVQAQELNPGSREVRSLQSKVSYELKQLKVAERESREGLMTTELNHKQLFKQEKLSYATKLAMLRRLLPEAGSKEEAKMELETCKREKAEALLESVAARGWTNVTSEEQMLFSSLWSAAQPRLGTTEIRDGRDAGVFPPRDEERIFGQNLPNALMAKPFPERLGWLSSEQKQRARGYALTIWKRGVEDLDHYERRFCEGLELLSTGSHNAPWHKRPLGDGGAQLILSSARRHKWAFIPATLRVQDAIMGGRMPRDELDDIRTWSCRPMQPGEVGIVKSNEACWRHALEQGWEWTLVLEDDCRVELAGGPLQLLALIQEVVASARDQEPDWQLLLLTPHGLEPFYDLCQPDHIPGLFGEACPAWTRKPKRLGDSGWKRVGPTFHAFGWIYRKPLMQALCDAMEAKAPPLNPLDVWVWEVMASRDMLKYALATKLPLVMTNDMPGGLGSVREAQGRVV